MNTNLIHAISKSVEQLIEVIQDVDDDNPPVEIDTIHINNDTIGGLVHNPTQATHLVVWAEVYAENRPGSVYPYKYAIYINKETCQTECDGY